MRKLFIFLSVFSFALILPGKEIFLSPENILILSGKKTWDEAQDLAYHFELITGRKKKVEVKDLSEEGTNQKDKYIFRFVYTDTEEAKKGKCTVKTGEKETVLEGRSGAAYWFLQKDLSVKWIRPGEKGIVYTPAEKISFKTGENTYIPKLVFRQIRRSFRKGRYNKNLPPALANYSFFQLTKEEYDRKEQEESLWRNRHRMGGLHPNYGHAFTKWYDRFHKTHPEYIAVNKYGKREPEQRHPTGKFSERDRSFTKICPTEKGVAEQVIREWTRRGKRGRINVCMNDMPQGFCRCERCLKIDGYDPRGNLPAYLPHVTDRYVFLANRVAEMSGNNTPVVLYAYESGLEAPRNIKIKGNIYAGIVPVTLETDKLEKLYSSWQKAGLKNFAIRPNLHYYTMKSGLFLGMEKQAYTAFQTAYKYGADATDYDHIMPSWAVSTFHDYTLARTFLEPEKSFEEIEKEFLLLYGNAASEMGEFYRYWRQEVWEKRLGPNYGTIVKKGRVHNFLRGLLWNLKDYYKESDFDTTDALLQKALKKDLHKNAKALVEEAVLANKHMRLIFHAVTKKDQEKYKAASDLLAFRKKYRNEMELDFIGLIATENTYRVTALPEVTGFLRNYPLPWVKMPIAWYFKADPENKGLKEEWYKKDLAEWKKGNFLRTDFFWSNPYRSETDPVLYKYLRSYKGAAWYCVRIKLPQGLSAPYYLTFPKLKGKCVLYIDGKKCGETEAKGGEGVIKLSCDLKGGSFYTFTLYCVGDGGPGALLWLTGGKK